MERLRGMQGPAFGLYSRKPIDSAPEVAFVGTGGSLKLLVSGATTQTGGLTKAPSVSKESVSLTKSVPLQNYKGIPIS